MKGGDYRIEAFDVPYDHLRMSAAGDFTKDSCRLPLCRTAEEYCSSQNSFASRYLLHRPAITVRIAEEDE